jgi:hypothetical protein
VRLLTSFIGLAALGISLIFSSQTLALNTHLYTGTSFGPDGTAGTQFLKAGALASDSSGNVYLAEIGGGKVEKFDSGGAPVDFSSTPGSNEIGGISFRGGANESQLAVTGAGGPIYATSLNSVLAFGADGAPLNFTAGPTAGTNELAGFSELLGVAIDANGAIYAGDYSGSYGSDPGISGGVAIYAPTGELLATFQSPQAGNLAVGPTGDVYVARYGGPVTRFVPSSFPVTGTTTYTEIGEVDPGPALAVSVNSATGDVFVDRGDRVFQYADDDSSIGSFPVGGSGSLIGSRGVTASGTGSGELVYGSDTEGQKRVLIFGPEVTLPDVTTGEATLVTNTSAKLAGIINPAGTEASYQFEYGPTTAYGQKAPVPPGAVGNDTIDHAVELDLTGLQPNTLYHYRLTGINAAGTNTGEDRTFRTSGPAGAETTGSPIRTATTALLEGRVNPQGKPTTFHFEYGSQGPCGVNSCQSTPDVEAGEGDEILLVAQRVTGLAPGSQYFYRLVADNGNSSGPSVGADLVVTTRASDAGLTHGSFNGPPASDRAWEQVNAADTGGHGINEIKGLSDDGTRVVYNVKGGTPGSSLGSLATPLIADRNASGWVTRGFTPPQQPGAGRELGWFRVAGSGDLSKLFARQETPGATALWALQADGPFTKLDKNDEASSSGYIFVASEDGSRVVAFPGATQENLYDVTAGTRELISKLPDGSTPSCGVTTELSAAAPAYHFPTVPQAVAHWVSSNGSLAFFPSEGNTCAGLSQLYVRDIDQEVTKRLSPPPVTGPSCSAAFIRATDDAAYFWSLSALTSEDIAPPACSTALSATGGDIYRYDLSTDTVACVTCGAADQAANVQVGQGSQNSALANIAVAEDESRVYFVTQTQLVSGAAVPGIYRLRTDDGDLRFVAPAEASVPNVGPIAAVREAFSLDGSTIVFGSENPALNPIGGLANGGTYQYYIYDDDTKSLACATCPQDGSAPTVPISVSESLGGGLLTAESPTAIGPNLTPLSADGSTFAFNTPTALVPQDQNTPSPSQNPAEGTDVYEWRDGKLLLVSDGVTNWTGAAVEVSSPKVAGVSRSGNDIFFTVAAQLTPDALESAPRLYDARIGGGFAFPTPPPPCPLEVCQGTPSPPPTQPTPGSAGFQGPGNPKPPKAKKCPKGKHKVKKNGKARCVKSKPKKNQRRAAGQFQSRLSGQGLVFTDSGRSDGEWGAK